MKGKCKQNIKHYMFRVSIVASDCVCLQNELYPWERQIASGTNLSWCRAIIALKV